MYVSRFRKLRISKFVKTPAQFLRARRGFDAVVFSGGGIKSIAMLGATHYLQERGYIRRAKTYIGTSAGAIIAAIMALGLDPKDVFERHVSTFKWRSDIDISLLDQGFGADTGASLDVWFKTVIDEDLTFETLRKKFGSSLIVCATNLNSRMPEYFGPETTPDFQVVKALRMSCSVPLYFSAVHHEGKMYVDGGVCDNFPIQMAVDLGYKNVLGLNFHPKEKQVGSKWTLDAFVGAVLESSLTRKIPENTTVISLECGSTTQPLDFKISEGTRRYLFQEGYRQTAAFFKKQE